MSTTEIPPAVDVKLIDESNAFGRAIRSDLVVIFTGFFALIGTCFTAFVGYKVAELNNRTNHIVSDISTIAVTTEKTHKLTNSSMEEQLRVVSNLYEWKATELSAKAEASKNPKHIEAAEAAFRDAVAARKRYEAHVQAGKEAEATPQKEPQKT